MNNHSSSDYNSNNYNRHSNYSSSTTLSPSSNSNSNLQSTPTNRLSPSIGTKSSNQSFSTFDQHSQQVDPTTNSHRLSAYVSPRLLNADHQLLPGGAKEFRDREFGVNNNNASNLGRSLSLGDRHHHAASGNVMNQSYQPTNLSHSTSNASNHHRLLASPSLNSTNSNQNYNSSPSSSGGYYNPSSTPSRIGTGAGDLPLPATTSSSSYNLLPIANTQSSSNSYNSVSSPQQHSSLGMDSLSSHYSPRSPTTSNANATSRQQSTNQRPHSYYDPSYASTGSNNLGGGGGSSHRQSIGPGFNDSGGLASPSQCKGNPNSNSRHASPSNANVSVGMGDETSGSGSRLSQRNSRRDLKNQDLGGGGGGLPTHNNHGIYDLLPSNSNSSSGNNRPSSSSAGLTDSLPYAYNSRDLVNGSMLPPNSIPQNPPSAPPPSSNQRNSTLGIHSSYNHHQSSTTSPTSSNSTVHGSYDPNLSLPLSSSSNALYQQQHGGGGGGMLDSSSTSSVNRSNSLRNQSTSGSGFHRVDNRNLREPAREVEFRRVRDSNDLRPSLEAAASGKGRRADPMGGYVSVSSF